MQGNFLGQWECSVLCSEGHTRSHIRGDSSRPHLPRVLFILPMLYVTRASCKSKGSSRDKLQKLRTQHRNLRDICGLRSIMGLRCEQEDPAGSKEEPAEPGGVWPCARAGKGFLSGTTRTSFWGVLGVLGIKLRTPCFPGRCCAAELHPSPTGT